MTRFIIERLRYSLEHVDEAAKESCDNAFMQESFKVGWLKNAIETAIKDLEKQCVTT